MANPQPTDAHIRIAHSIAEAIMTRDFTKRQRSILDLILRLSWGCGKKTAIIPKLMDFQTVGIAKSKIRCELEWLVNAKVIVWNRETNTYSFQKDFEQWAVSLVPGYDRKRLDELLHINLSSQNGNIIDETETKFPKCRNKVPEMPELFESANTDTERVSGQSKESIKESIKIYTPEFEAFYSEYPRSEDKRRTFNNWKKQLNHYSVEQLMAACRNYKTAKAGTEKQYLKTSANFLGREKPFEDYLDENYKQNENYSSETAYPYGNIIKAPAGWRG